MQPTEVMIDEDDQKQLAKLHDRQVAIKNFVDTITRQGEAAFMEIQREGREIWTKLAQKYELDLEKATYDLDQSGTKLVLKQIIYKR